MNHLKNAKNLVPLDSLARGNFSTINEKIVETTTI